jgi:hypothetical protein
MREAFFYAEIGAPGELDPVIKKAEKGTNEIETVIGG